MTHNVEETYRHALGERRLAVQGHERRDRTLSTVRLLVAVVGVAAWGFVMASRPGAVAVLIAAVVAFLGLVVFHERVARDLARARRRVAFYENTLARMAGEWVGKGEPGERFADPAHSYAADLDLFGRGSLFERLNTARTRSGEDLLASWLKAPSPVDEIRERQAAVGEIGPKVALREDLAVLGGEAKGAVDSTSLREWATAPAAPVPASLRLAAAALSAVTFTAVGMWLFGPWGPQAFYAAAIAVVIVHRGSQRWSTPVLAGVGRPAQHLVTLAELIDRVGQEAFTSPRLARLAAAFHAEEGGTPAEHISRLRRWLEIHDSKRNAFFAPIAFVMLWDLQLAGAIEGWRQSVGGRVARWLHALGEIEATAALGAYAYENPEDPFPTFEGEGPFFHADGIAHPLLSPAKAVRNSLALDANRCLMVVTGSNMSGKSTLLRTVGVNTVLALAGAPVRARSLRLSSLAVGASIRIQDSLLEGQSRFYAEITRIRQVMDLAKGSPPLLFLLDEIFHGTNSADRRVGAEAVVRTLVQRRAIGLVTSHDLALADIADSLAPAAANVHFDDHLEGDRIAFDYRLKPGRVEKSNALALMRAVGLEV